MYLAPARLWRLQKQRRAYLGKTGTLVTWSVVRVGPEGLEKRVPYIVGMVRVGTEKITAQIVEAEPETLKKGMKLTGRMRRLFDVPDDELIVYGVKFAPLRGDQKHD